MVVRMPFPATTMSRKGTTHALRVRTVSTTARMAASADDHDRLSQVSDGIESARRERRGVPVSPARHALVQPHQVCVAADEVGEYR